jgi:SecD/SecF fusion protein
MTATSILILVYFAVLIGLTLFFSIKESPLWKTALIALVLSAFGLALWFPGEDGYGPKDRLIPGLDLAGGTTLVYDVKVPTDRDAKSVIDDTISILSKRVDPSGTRNLVWRQVAGNRLEVQMPLPDPETSRRRQAYREAREAVLTGNITEHALDAALRAQGDQREAELKKFAGDSPELLASLKTLAEANEVLAAATKANEAAQADYDKATADLKALPANASEDDRAKAQATVEDLRKDLQDKAMTYLDAKDVYDAAKQAVLDANVTEAELDRIEDLSAPDSDGPGITNYRRDAADKLIEAHPQKKQQINAWYDAYRAYETKKGQLDDPDDLIKLLQGSGVLEFRIVPAPNDPGLDAQSYRDQLAELGPRAGRDKPWIWAEIDDIEKFIDGRENLPELEADPAGYFERSRGQIGQRYADKYYILLGNVPSLAMTQDQNWALRSARPTVDPNSGQPAVAFTLDSLGGERMSQITGPNIHKQMAILLDGKVISSPTLQSKIAGQGQITGGAGGFTPAELSYLVNTLKAGSLEGELSKRPISQKTIGAKFGQDNIESGYTAARDALIIVAIFMLIYYLFAGLIADFALLANMVLILGVMAALRSTFTLPGIAGIVLTIGMAVDANVLIFERIREEAERGADLATSVRLGFEKALSTILDANITTLITCIVLGYTATVEIKGFAVTLGIGILATLFTALFCSRVFLELYLKYGKAKRLPMLPTIVPGIGRLLSPNVNWVGMRYIFFVISATAIIFGMIVLYERGEDVLDIEFRSGTKVSFTLAEGETLDLTHARERLRAYGEAGKLIQDAKPAPPELTDEVETLTPIVEAAQRRYDDAYKLYLEAEADPNIRALPEPRKVDFSLFINAADSGIVTEGDTVPNPDGTVNATGFGISTLVEDAQAVSAVIKAAFADVLDTTRPIEFASIEVDEVNNAPVYPIRSATLGDNIGRASDVRIDVAEAIGGVAIVLDDLTPPVTQADLAQRVERMRMLPAYESLDHRESRVYALDPAGTADNGETLYRSAVIVTHDDATNYVESPESFGDAGGLADTEWQLARDACQRDTSLGSVSNFSSQVSGTMKQQAIVAMGLSLLAVVVYIWFRFGSFTYGLAAILALVHDVAISLGFIAISSWVYQHVPHSILDALMLEPFKIDLAMIAAILTIIGYSLNDTIVVFDRIRENRGRLSYATPQVINDSINQTISRTVLTSGTTLLAVAMLYVFGGAGVHGFAFAMFVGILVGTYSSIAVASPLLMLGGERHVQKDKPERGVAVTEK